MSIKIEKLEQKKYKVERIIYKKRLKNISKNTDINKGVRRRVMKLDRIAMKLYKLLDKQKEMS